MEPKQKPSGSSGGSVATRQVRIMIDELDFTAPRHELEWRARRPAGGSDDAAAARVLGVTGAGEPQRFVESVI